MHYFEDPNGQLHALDSVEFVGILPTDCVEISEAEYKTKVAESVDPKDLVLAEIARLENSVTPRRLRDAVLQADNGWLADVEAKIAILRAKL